MSFHDCRKAMTKPPTNCVTYSATSPFLRPMPSCLKTA